MDGTNSIPSQANIEIPYDHFFSLCEKAFERHGSILSLPMDRAFDDDGNIIFLHLGRGVGKSSGEGQRGASSDEWIQYAYKYLLDSFS